MLPKAMGSNELPTIVNTKSGVYIRHKEYLGDIVNTAAFTNTVFPLNPGLEATFPWLSQVASAFEEYEWRGLVFQFRTMSSDMILSTATSTALGSVVMATQYDVLDTPFYNKSQMENHCYANSRKPSESFLHGVECARGNSPVTRLFTRSGAVPATGDARLYDLGNFQIATQGMQGTGTGTIGELWCSYEIRLFKPQVNESTLNLYDHFILGGTQSLTNLLGSTPSVATLNSSLGSKITQISGSANLILPPNITSGRFLVTIVNCPTSEAQITDPSYTTPSAGSSQNILLVADQHAINPNYAPSPQSSSGGPPQSAMTITTFEFDVVSPFAAGTLSAVVVLKGNGSAFLGACKGDLRIIQIDPTVF